MASSGLDTPEPACPVCGGIPNPARLPYVNHPPTDIPKDTDPFVELENRYCSICGFGWAWPPVASDLLDRYYMSGYWSDYSQGNMRPIRQGFAPLEPRPVAQLTLARLYRVLEGAMLDIGPGPRGGSFRALAEMAPHMRGFAFEPDIASAEFLSTFLNVRVVGSSFPAHADLRQLGVSGGFQLVLMSHVLEHFNGRDVVATLQAAGSLLAKTGILVCEVPHVDLRQHASVRGNDSPHLSFFSVAGVRRAFERAGLEPIFANTCGPRYVQTSSPTRSSVTTVSANPSAVREGALRSWARRIPINIPKPLGARLYSLVAPEAAVRMLRSDAFDYGGDDRTWLRVVAKHV